MRHKRQHSPTEALVIVTMRSAAEPYTYDRLIEMTGASQHTLPAIMRRLRRAGIVTKTMQHGIAYFAIAPEPQVK